MYAQTHMYIYIFCVLRILVAYAYTEHYICFLHMEYISVCIRVGVLAGVDMNNR